MQHVLTYNSHLQAKLRTVIALQGGCAHLGSKMAATSQNLRKPQYSNYHNRIQNYPISQLQKKWAQPPHKQKAETYRITSGPKKPPPAPLQRRAPKAEEQRTQVAFAHATHLTLLTITQ